MKSKFIYAAMTVFAFCACQKESEIKSPINLGERVELTVNVGSAQTRAVTADTPEESKVNSIQVFVFRPDGTVDAYKKASASPVTGVSCTAGTRTIYAVVNCPTDLSTIKSLTDFNAKTLAFANEKLGGFQMVGNTSKNITLDDANVTLTVDRAVAKIHLSNIKLDFQAAVYKNMPFKITRIYAINVIGNYAVTYPTSVVAPSVNVAKCGTSLSADSKVLLLWQPSSPITVTNGADATSIDRSFYVYPNYSTIEGNKTRIVVEATLGGTTYYYPLTFGTSIKANTYYDITGLLIKRQGSDNPNVPVVTKDCVFNVNVIDWSTGESINPSI